MARRTTPVIDAVLADRPVINAIRNGVRAAAERKDTATTTADIPAVTQSVVEAVAASPDIAVVPVKSGLLSKVNWTQFASIGATLLAWIGLDLSAEQLVAVITGIQAVQSIATVIFKTWFTKSVTPQSAAKPT